MINKISKFKAKIRVIYKSKETEKNEGHIFCSSRIVGVDMRYDCFSFNGIRDDDLGNFLIVLRCYAS